MAYTNIAIKSISTKPQWRLRLCHFYEGTIYVDIAAESNGKTKSPTRAGAVDVAFIRIQSDERYEFVYLRTANGRLNFPPQTERLGQAV